MKKIFAGLSLLLLLFIAYLILNTITHGEKTNQNIVEQIDQILIDDSSVVRFSQALQIKTISHQEKSKQYIDSFRAFNQLLEKNYPLSHQQLEHKVFNEFSHLFTWSGSNNSLKPIVLLGHTDVVPIASPGKWSQDPFSGLVKDGVIWGRGTIDDKINVIGILEAVELLLKDGFRPERTIILAFGHDEEISGHLGALTIANYLQSQGIVAEYILDEGYGITRGMIPYVKKDVALIGTAEKGYTSLELSVDMSGGHSSMPQKESAIDVLAKAVATLKQNPFPAEFSGSMLGFLDEIANEMPFHVKLLFANKKIFKPLILNIYEQSASGNALIRTTTAPTIFQAGIKDNVIPTNAKAVVNFRTVPGSTADDVIAHVNEIVNDERVKIKLGDFSSSASKVSPIDTLGYKTLRKSIQEIYPNTAVAPNLVIGATDARHYGAISKNIYRFVPYFIDETSVEKFHGIDESISVVEYKDAIRFYTQLIKNSQLSE